MFHLVLWSLCALAYGLLWLVLRRLGRSCWACPTLPCREWGWTRLIFRVSPRCPSCGAHLVPDPHLTRGFARAGGFTLAVIVAISLCTTSYGDLWLAFLMAGCLSLLIWSP